MTGYAEIVPKLFPGFEPFRLDAGEVEIAGIQGGSGPPLLLLHGWPQSLLEWHRVAPALAERFTVVATDLRGYGASGVAADGEGHAGYSKRAMAADQVAVMRRLGHERFAVVGHDRGARVAHRMALDHRERIERLAVLDIVPTRTMYRTTNEVFATLYFHWFFLIQPAPIPETLLGDKVELVLRHWVFRGLGPDALPPEVYERYARAFAEPDRLHAMCEDYRASASIDLAHDEADLDRPIECPLLVLWGKGGVMERLYDVLATWRERAADVRGGALPGGHWLPEEVPDRVRDELLGFFGPGGAA
ncbi:MAG: alpha/beta hydrolase [Gemmatimonadales bacterium]